MALLLSFLTLLGLNFTVWASIGILRFLMEKFRPDLAIARTEVHTFTRWFYVLLKLLAIDRFSAGLGAIRRQAVNFARCRALYDGFPDFKHCYTRAQYGEPDRFKPLPRVGLDDIAAIIPAHNEEQTIAHTVKRLKAIMPAKNIYVGSDASTDRTVEIVENLGCNVVDIRPNRGKANVLTFLLDYFGIITRYEAVLIVDADSEVDDNYLKRAIPLLNDPDVVAVAGHASSKWEGHLRPRWNMFFAAYRVRLYRVLQAVMRYGQTWKYTNVSMIIPGFASLYRTAAIKQIEINAPGLIIEDYNMTFEVHHKKLGKIAYDPGVVGISEDPISLKDYIKQVKRWNLGFWQTVRRHGFWPSVFSVALLAYMAEMIFFSAFLLIIPLLFAWLLLHSFEPILITPYLAWLHLSRISLLDLLVGVLLIDYLITAIVAIYEKKPVLLLYGAGFIILRYIDAFLFLYTLPLSFIVMSEGRWVSPKRQAMAEA